MGLPLVLFNCKLCEMSDAYLRLLGVGSVEDENEYFKEWYTLHRGWNPHAFVLDVYLSIVKDRELYFNRSILVHKFSWAVPSAAALVQIQDFCKGRRIIEIGAGTGYWASLLQAHGQVVVAVDNCKEPVDHQYTQVIRADGCSFLDAHDTSEDVLMCCWPRCMEAWLEAFKGRGLIWIGEVEGATDYIQEDDPSWQLDRECMIPVHMGMRDRLRMYSRNVIQQAR